MRLEGEKIWYLILFALNVYFLILCLFLHQIYVALKYIYQKGTHTFETTSLLNNAG